MAAPSPHNEELAMTLSRLALVFVSTLCALIAVVVFDAATVIAASSEVARDSAALPLARCRRRVGPFATQRRAYAVRRYYRARGYQVSGVWGQGGLYHGSRRYYFNLFFRCQRRR
jgi:hypothetical protein